MYKAQEREAKNNPESLQGCKYMAALSAKSQDQVKKNLNNFLKTADSKWDTYKLAIDHLAQMETEKELEEKYKTK